MSERKLIALIEEMPAQTPGGVKINCHLEPTQDIGRLEKACASLLVMCICRGASLDAINRILTGYGVLNIEISSDVGTPVIIHGNRG